MLKSTTVSLVLALEACGIMPAMADDWTIYREGSCQVSFPRSLFTKDVRQSGHPALFSGPNEKTFFRIMEADNEEEFSLKTLRNKYFGADVPGDVSYQRSTEDFLVLSGYRRDRIFYTRVELSADKRTICILELTYPRKQKRSFDQLVTRMSHSFSASVDVPNKKAMKAPLSQFAKRSSMTTAAKQQSQGKKQNASISCERASKILDGYGFSSVKASNCEGKEYAFAATRDGKSYVIKMSSANGELIQVKKQ